MESDAGTPIVWDMPPHRPDDRVRLLCAKVVASSERDLGSNIAELKAALREHNQRLRKLAIVQLGRL